MQDYVQFHFRGRKQGIAVPVSEKQFSTERDRFVGRSKPLRWFEFQSVAEHFVWVNGARLQMVRLLEEVEKSVFDPLTLKPSEQKLEANLQEVFWNITFLLCGSDDPVEVNDVSGEDWWNIILSRDGHSDYFTLTDQDGEELVVRMGDIDMYWSLERGRYSDEELEVADKLFRVDLKPNNAGDYNLASDSRPSKEQREQPVEPSIHQRSKAGSILGKASSEAKAEAARRNGKLGGRPRKMPPRT